MHLRELNKLAAYGGNRTSATRSPSKAVWRDCPYYELVHGLKDGHAYYNDFLNGYVQATNVAAGSGINRDGITAFTGNDAGNTITTGASSPFGESTLLLTGDNLTTVLAIGGGGVAGAGGQGQWVFESGKRLWAEARVKVSVITDDRGGWFVGFGEENLAVTIGVIGATDALTDKDLIGYHRDAADGDKLDIKHNTASGGGITALSADAVTLVADTYVKLGFYFDGTYLRFYADGVYLTRVARTATNFPSGEEMAFYIAGTNKGTTANSLSVDWVRIAQERTE